MKTSSAIHWIEIYLMDSATHISNNWAQYDRDAWDAFDDRDDY